MTYQIFPCHQPAVYAPGTTPDDINPTATEPIGVTGGHNGSAVPGLKYHSSAG